MKNDFSKQFRPILEVAYAEAQNFSSSAILSEHFVLACPSKQGRLRIQNSSPCKSR